GSGNRRERREHRVRRLARAAGSPRRVRPHHFRCELRGGGMSPSDKPHVNLGTLRRHLRGVPVTRPGDEGWDLARQAFNTRIDQRPALIATPLNTDDVAAVVRYAADAGLQVAPQRTGHNAGPLGDLSDSILLKTDQLQGVQIDVEARTARVRS